jgi:hypothetical protein
MPVDEFHLIALKCEAKLLRLPAFGKKGALGGVCIGAVVGVLLFFVDDVLVVNAVKPFKSQPQNLQA